MTIGENQILDTCEVEAIPGETLREWFDRVTRETPHLLDAEIDWAYENDRYGNPENIHPYITVSFVRDMTDAEIDARAKRAVRVAEQTRLAKIADRDVAKRRVKDALAKYPDLKDEL